MESNEVFQEILKCNNSEIFLDTNFFIPPDGINYDDFQKYWVEFLLSHINGFKIHESVNNELIPGTKAKDLTRDIPVCCNSSLTIEEKYKYDLFYAKISEYINVGGKTKNKNSGEVETLAYMCTKNAKTIISRDKDVILNLNQINENCIVSNINGKITIIHFYELIFYIHINQKDKGVRKFLKVLYKKYYPNGVEDHKCYADFIQIMKKVYNILTA